MQIYIPLINRASLCFNLWDLLKQKKSGMNIIYNLKISSSPYADSFLKIYSMKKMLLVKIKF